MRLLALVVLVVGAGVLLQAEGTAQRPRCATGEAHGFATIRPFPPELAGQITGTFSRDVRWFLTRYNCRGLSVEVRRLQTGIYDLRFPGLKVTVIAGVGLAESQMSVSMQPLDDIVRIRLFSDGRPDDAGFSVVVY